MEKEFSHTENPIRISSEKELLKEIEKVSSMLTPEQDWSVRLAAMQRVEGLVAGGATDYPTFPSLLKQLVGPLCLQLSDRRSSIVKQACHLLNLLSKELVADFEPLAESFIPVLFKMVVITVLVIAESADNCIKTMLRNCRVSRVLPRIVDCAKNDRSAILRARCCEYAFLVLEQWADSPEIQRSAELFEDLIRCCVGDAISEVRSTARICYRLFAKSWPDRSRRLFSAFDPVIQRVINEEDGGGHKRYTSPSARDRGHQRHYPSHVSTQSIGSSAQVQPERQQATAAAVGPVPASVHHIIQKKPAEQCPDRNLENALHASQQQVSVIETMLKGMEIPEKTVVSTASRLIGKDPAGGSYRKIHAPTMASRVNVVDPPSARDPPHPANIRAPHMPSANARAVVETASSESLRIGGLSKEPAFTRGPKRVLKSELQLEKPVPEISSSYVPGFQRPLMRGSVSGRSSVSSRSSMEEAQASATEHYGYLDGIMSLNETLNEGLAINSDWSARVTAFTHLRKLLQQGPRGLQDISQNFEKVMKLFYEHLDDPHHKVAQAALSTLSELVPVYRKSFEGYLERILPRVFLRLIDSKEVIRQLGTSALETVGNIYSIDFLLPALLRSLDEQRSPKAKMAVIEFAIAAFAKLALSGEAAGGSGLLKLWLAKLAPLATDKNPKLKETAVTGIISVYSHFDSTTVLNFILGLSIEEQSILRRALKQYTPRIEVDLMTYLQNRNQKGRHKAVNEQPTVCEDSSGKPSRIQLSAAAVSVNGDSAKKWSEAEHESYGGASHVESAKPSFYQSCETSRSSDDPLAGYANFLREVGIGLDESSERPRNLSDRHSYSETVLNTVPDSQSRPPTLRETNQIQSGYEHLYEEKSLLKKVHQQQQQQQKAAVQDSSSSSSSSLPSLLRKLVNWVDESSEGKHEALQELINLSRANDSTIWSQHWNEFSEAAVQALDDADIESRELAVSTISEMLKNQKSGFDKSLEPVLKKLLTTVGRDTSAKVAAAADRCLSTVLSQCDPYRCLTIIVPHLSSEEDKTLVTCISSLTKLVSRLPQEELMAQLPCFLPSLFDAFGNQNADVRKSVVFCLVDIYIVLGKAFVPYLGSLSSSQLRLVTIYANRISQARTGATVDSLN